VVHRVTLLQESLVVWRAELARAVRSGRVPVLLALYGLFSTLVLLVVGAFVRMMREQLALQAAQANVSPEEVYAKMREGFLGALLGEDITGSGALDALPIVVLVVFKLSLFFLPAYVTLMGFDQVSSERASRSLRYLVVRARRASVLAGKFLSQATVLLALVALVNLGLFAYALLTEPDFPLGAALPAFLRLWLAAGLFSVAYVALTTLCSTLVDSPGLSLALNFLLLFCFWLMDVVGTGAALSAEARGEEAGPVALLRYLSPSHYAGDLLHPQLGPFALSGLAYALFATLFLVAAWQTLRARDV
jgi:ABC-type transport system involved in multi-copper enzyme maturation permease subunit